MMDNTLHPQGLGMKQYVFAATQFEAIHQWLGAPEQTRFQAAPHRHIFRVRAEKLVEEDRQYDTITLKRMIEHCIVAQLQKTGENGQQLCVTWGPLQWARILLEEMDLDRCEVSEDGEMGALVDRQTRILVPSHN
jgi:hypothetical protein